MINWDADLLAPTHQVFGEQADYHPAAGPPRPGVTVVFNEAFTSITFEDGQEVASKRPVLNVRAGLLSPPPEQGDLWRVRGILYQTVDTKPDGLGDIRVDLRLASNDQARLAPLAPIQPP